MNVLDALIAAKALIPDELHWWQTGRSDLQEEAAADHCVCAGVAIIRAAGKPLDDLAGRVFAEANGLVAPGALLPVLWRSIYTWNDDPERTLAEVHAAFDQAIAIAGEAQ